MSEPLFCVKCGTAGSSGEAFCGACGAALPKPAERRSGTAAAPDSDARAATGYASLPLGAARQPVTTTGSGSGSVPVTGELTVFPWWQVIIFSIISYGVWTLYWFYCTRKQVSGLVETNRDDPGIQTFGWLVPIWQVWVVRDMWRDIDGVAQKAGTEGINAQSYAMWFWICSYVWFVNYVGWIVVLVFYVITQSRLMAALKALNGGVTVNRRVTPWSAVWAFGPIALLL